MVQFSPEGRKKERPMSPNPVAKQKVREAVKREDSATLSVWGTRGAEAATESKRKKKRLDFENRVAEEQLLARETNEKDVPIDDSPAGNVRTDHENRHPDLQ